MHLLRKTVKCGSRLQKRLINELWLKIFVSFHAQCISHLHVPVMLYCSMFDSQWFILILHLINMDESVQRNFLFR